MAGYQDEEQDEEEDEWDLCSRHVLTDRPCCAAFLSVVLAFGAVYVWCLLTSDAQALERGFDGRGRLCGKSGGVVDRPYVYWCRTVNSTKELLVVNLTDPVCVSDCPRDALESVPPCLEVAGVESTMYAYRSSRLRDRFCLPDVDSLQPEAAEARGSIEGPLVQPALVLAEALPDALHARFLPYAAAGLGAALLLVYPLMLCLHWCGESLVCCGAILNGTLLASVAIMGVRLLGDAAKAQGGNRVVEGIVTDLPLGPPPPVVAAAGLCVVASAALAVCACRTWRTVRVALSCAEVALEPLFVMPALLLVPPLQAVASGAWLVACLRGLVLLAAAGGGASTSGLFPTLDISRQHLCCCAFYLLAAGWTLAFGNALCRFAIAYAVADYYYRPIDIDGDKESRCCAVATGFCVGLAYHTGSLASVPLKTSIACVRGDEVLPEVDVAVTSCGWGDERGRRGGTNSPSVLAATLRQAGDLAAAGVVFACALAAYAYCGADAYACPGVGPPAAALFAGLGAALVAPSALGAFTVSLGALLHCYALDIGGRGGQAPTAPPSVRELVLAQDNLAGIQALTWYASPDDLLAVAHGWHRPPRQSGVLMGAFPY